MPLGEARGKYLQKKKKQTLRNRLIHLTEITIKSNLKSMCLIAEQPHKSTKKGNAKYSSEVYHGQLFQLSSIIHPTKEPI
jgi:hypothetical protein